jgi:hypothetical protein
VGAYSPAPVQDMRQPMNPRRFLTSTLGLILILLLNPAAYANSILNGSFENGTFVPDTNNTDELSSGSTAITDWTTINGVPTAWIKNVNPWDISAADGQFFLDLTGYSDAGTYGGVSQSFATVAGTNYVVTFDVGYGGNSANFDGPVSVRAIAPGFNGTFTSASGSQDPAVWNLETFNFTATSSLSELSLTGLSTAGGYYIGLDNVDVEPSAAVPEPSSWELLGLTLLVLVGAARKKWLGIICA